MLFPRLSALVCAALAVIPCADAQSSRRSVVGARSGINPQTGELPARRNINELFQEAGPQWDLYVGALSAMQEAGESDSFGYFQLMAIHGQPFIPWSGGGPQQGGNYGFCPHNEPLFGTWHRGYLAAYEFQANYQQQALVGQAQRIAATYPQAVRSRYVEAANRLRAPYWDWAANSNVPAATASSTVSIRRPRGGSILRESVRNPLYSYRYPSDLTSGRYGRFRGTGSTSRCTRSGESYPGTANRELSEQNLRNRVYTSLTRARSWAEISSTSNGRNSLEGPHGTIHVLAACGSDFMYLETAAFDPLFMLHHTNVDRLLAYWQALNYDNYTMEFRSQTRGLYNAAPGTVITQNSNLAPFDGQNSRPLTSNSVVDIEDWGYTYAPMRPWDASGGQIRTAVTRTVNELYGPRGRTLRSRDVYTTSNSTEEYGYGYNEGEDEGENEGQEGEGQAYENEGENENQDEGEAYQNETETGTETGQNERPVEREYYVNVEVERSDVELPAMVDVYVRGHHAGMVAWLGMPMSGMSYDEIPLHEAIEAAGLQDLGADELLEMLNTDLQINVTKADGSCIPLDSIPSLKIEVEDVDVIQPLIDIELPLFGEGRRLPIKIKALGIEIEIPLPILKLPAAKAEVEYEVGETEIEVEVGETEVEVEAGKNC